MLVRLVQPLKALYPIEVRPLDILMLVRLVQPLKAYPSIFWIVAGSVTV